MSAHLVALTGGIGAGKSTVARMLVAHGARLVDADALARAVVDPTTPIGRQVLDAIATELGPEYLREDGSLDRERTARVVFADDARRERYNAIVHPAMIDATVAAIAAERPRAGVIVHEIPLLTARTGHLPWRYDLVVTVEASTEERVRRLTEERGYSREHALARIHAQGAEEGRVSIADVVLRSDGTLADTASAVEALWRRLTP